MAMKKALGRHLARAGTANAGPAFRLPVPALRERMAGMLVDCNDLVSQRVALKLHVARTPQELWMLRSDVYSCIAQAHNQDEARQRINDLLPGFEGWLPERQLVRI
ncbi:MAG: hypothetical protein ABW051_03460 [Burkholderiaceae bacterium]